MNLFHFFLLRVQGAAAVTLLSLFMASIVCIFRGDWFG